MPKFYCDYCDIYLTHDSANVRKTHGSGWKHKSAGKKTNQTSTNCFSISFFFSCLKKRNKKKIIDVF